MLRTLRNRLLLVNMIALSIMMIAAFKLSEEYDTPVMLRLTTRVCHSKSIVACGGLVNYAKARINARKV